MHDCLTSQGGTLADRMGGKVVMAWGIAVFSLTSLLMPLALSKAVRLLPSSEPFQ